MAVIQAKSKDYNNLLLQQGFTLVELLVTISIMAIIAGMAVPSLLNQVKRYEANAVASYVKSFLVQARQDALIYQSPIIACVADQSQQCLLENGEYLLSFIDKNANQRFDAGIDTLQVHEKLNLKFGKLVTVTSVHRNMIQLKPENGRPLGYIGHIKYCPTNNDPTHMFKVTFNNVGIIKIRKNSEEATGCS